MDDRQKFDKLLQIYATIQPYRAPDFANRVVLEYWHREFGDIPLDQLKASLDYWMRNESHFPSIAEVRKSFGLHEEDPDVESRQIVANIMAAMRTYGWCREIEARKHLGDLAWAVVNGVGGWQMLSDVTISNQATITAQMRELAKSYLITKRFPKNDNSKPLLQEGAKKAIEIATAATRCFDKTKVKGITNTIVNTRLAEGE